MTTTNDTTATTTDTTPLPEERDLVVEKAARALVGVGVLWARYGIGVGRAALETSATTLQATAEILKSVSDGLHHEER